MNLYPINLLTIISIDTIETKLIQLFKKIGIKGYTISEAEGEGLSQLRDNNWEGRNKRIEILLNNEMLEKILDILQEEYFPKYKIITFVQDVKILRREKFQ